MNSPPIRTVARGVIVASAATAFAFAAGCSNSGGSPTSPPGGGGNHNPSISVNTSGSHLGYGGTATITVIASDIDGDQLSFAYSGAGGTVSASGPTATTATFTAGNQWGPASVTVTASDGRGGTTQATASMYIRNPNPPAITIAPTGSSTCGYGTSSPGCFLVRMSTPETVSIREFIIIAANETSCRTDWTYNNITVSAGASYQFQQPGNTNTCAACSPCNGVNVTNWDVYILGRRPEPDGGSFTWTASQWRP